MATSQAAKDANNKLEEYIEKSAFLTLNTGTDRKLIVAFCRIHYSDRYTDDEYEYRHVILPKQLLKMVPKQFFNQDDTGTLRLLAEPEWRGIGITQSLGWEHYEVHGDLSAISHWRRDTKRILSVSARTSCSTLSST